MLKVKPVYLEKIWGGTKLKELGFEIPKRLVDKKIGEAWIISAYEKSPSILENGQKLNDFYSKNKNLFNNFPANNFPLLVKILDAKNDLSIQVHPNDEMANELENYPYGKTECWYILDVKDNSNIIIGTNANNEIDASKMILTKQWDKFLNKLPIQKDDVFDIKSGTVHAILHDTVVYELQQSSDITYRIYDFDRVDKNGNLRELHIEKSLRAIDYKSKPSNSIPKILQEDDKIKISLLIKNSIFSLEKWEVNGEIKLSFDKDEKHFLLLTVIEGEVIINNKKFSKYESGIVTSNELKEIEINGYNVKILVGNPNL